MLLRQHLNKQEMNGIIAANLSDVFCSAVQVSDCVCIICVLLRIL